jgi:FMN-dependent oxidoreductase (nitrilotriacetate monooxygenase family)
MKSNESALAVQKPAPAEVFPGHRNDRAQRRPRARKGLKHVAGTRFHLGWFTNFALDAWNEPLSSGGGAPWTGEIYVDLAKALERACFDYMILEDTLMVSNVYGGTMDRYLRSAIAVPKHDPAPLAAVIGSRTQHLGVVATLSTLGYPPFLLARLCATLDHICQGRFGWNIVTSGEDAAAQNFGLDAITEHDLRYEMADEYVDVVNRLFASWDPDAVVLDREHDVYADPSRVRAIDFQGRFFRSRGPINTAPMANGRPVYVQAGGSPKGRDFAARHADSVIATAQGPGAMKAFRDDIRQRAASHGRNPDDIKVLFLLAPVLGDTEAEAIAKNARGLASRSFQERTLAFQSALCGIDLSGFDLDEPLPPLETNGSKAVLAAFAQWGSGKPLRQLIHDSGKGGVIDAVGTPGQVADQMIEAMDAVGGDGFLIQQPYGLISRRAFLEITEGLVPALQMRGAVRTRYATASFRETLREF